MSNIHAINTEDGYDQGTRMSTLPSMSVYTYPWRWSTWRGFWQNIKQWFDNRKAAKQRAKLGYCYSDVWDCGDSIIDHMIVMLIEYRNKTYVYPDSLFSSFEDWIKCIDTIIDKLEYSRQNRNKMNDYYRIFESYLNDNADLNKKEEWESVREAYYEEDLIIYNAQVEARKEALALFAQYADAIWW